MAGKSLDCNEIRVWSMPVADLRALSRHQRVALAREAARITRERRAVQRLMTEMASPLRNDAVHAAGTR